MDTNDIKKRLWYSLDMTTLRQELILVILVTGISLLFAGVFQGGLWEPGFGTVAGVLAAVIILPFLIYDICVSVKLYRRAECYRLYRAELSQFHHQAWSRGAMYFTVVLEDEGGRFAVNTRPIFASWGCAGPLLEDYNGKTVTIAYNEDTEAVVVLG